MAGHMSSLCKAKSKQTVQNEKQQRHSEATDEPNKTDETVKEVNTGICCEKNSEFEFDARLNGVPLRIELDTGAEALVAPRSVWVLLGQPKLHTGPRFKVYGCSSLPNLLKSNFVVFTNDFGLPFSNQTTQFYFSVYHRFMHLTL